MKFILATLISAASAISLSQDQNQLTPTQQRGGEMLHKCDIGTKYFETNSTEKIGDWFTNILFEGPTQEDPVATLRNVANFLGPCG